MNAFLPLLASQANLIGPMAGVAELGSDPQRTYIAVRAFAPLTPPEGAVATDTQTGIALLGVWA